MKVALRKCLATLAAVVLITGLSSQPLHAQGPPPCSWSNQNFTFTTGQYTQPWLGSWPTVSITATATCSGGNGGGCQGCIGWQIYRGNVATETWAPTTVTGTDEALSNCGNSAFSQSTNLVLWNLGDGVYCLVANWGTCGVDIIGAPDCGIMGTVTYSETFYFVISGGVITYSGQ